MSGKFTHDHIRKMKAGEEVEQETNRTIILTEPTEEEVFVGRSARPAAHGSVAPRSSKREIEDLVGGVNINQYISSELDTSSMLASPLDDLHGKYALLEKFAHGGTASVSIARDRNLRRLVAVKSLKKDWESNPKLLDIFVAEAKMTAQLDHPGIIPIYGLARDEDHGIHLVMKLVNGKTLREYLQNITLNYRIRGIENFDEDMQLRKRLEIFLRVCDTISYAHHRNVLHRDLKPENIMIGRYMEVFVMDWGLAKTIPPKDSATPPPKEPLAGTPRYFAPEVLRGERLDPRSDLFTLGLILQEIVTLQYAVQGDTSKKCMEMISKGELAPLEHLYHRKINRYLQAIIRKATAYWPKERYQSADDLAEDLRRYMAGLPISACPETFLDRIIRYFFGHRL